MNLKKVKAYTIYSQDDEKSSSCKGLFKAYEAAAYKAPGSGWFGSNGEVIELDDVYEDSTGELFRIERLGQFDDVSEQFKQDVISSIKSKVTKEEFSIIQKALDLLESKRLQSIVRK